MKERDDPQLTIKALRERITRLTEASLRINASLDLKDVLHEVLEKARLLTGARCGFIFTVDEDNRLANRVHSGLTPQEFQQLLEWPDGLRMFEHLRSQPEPLRVDNHEQYLREMGFSAHPLQLTALYGSSMRHRGQYVGHFFLAEKQDGQPFTDEDEEILVLFASQAATAIANARTYRMEQQARADMEALVDTSPIAVMIYDGRSGDPISINRETRRLLNKLMQPGQTIEQLYEIMTCHWGDGTEVSLKKLSLARQFNDVDKVRAREIMLSVPDGRSIAALVNATPIHAEDGTVHRVVVTAQDLAPLQEVERLRAQFIGMVSQELRAPLTSIKGSAAALLDSSVALDPDEWRDYVRIVDRQADRMRTLISELLEIGRIETGTLSVRPESWEVATLVERARHRFLKSSSYAHTILVDLPPNLPRVMVERRRIVQVLGNLFSNAARHSSASSPIRVSAVRDDTHVAVSVLDESPGVAPERLPDLFRKYTGADGGQRGGLGLAICKGLVEAHGGRIWAQCAAPRHGVRISFTLPIAEDGDDIPGQPYSPARARERILMVGDDPPTLRYVRDVLTDAGYRPTVKGDHRELGHLIRTEAPRLVLLDLMRPSSGGIELMRRVPELSEVPVIFMSGRGRDEMIAKALQSGATDYIAKPFSATELTARIGAALRKRAKPEPFVLGELAIDYERRSVAVGGRPVKLTATEYELLRVLSLSAGRVVTFDSLIRQVWRKRGPRRGHRRGNPKLVRAFIRSLRSKLGDDAEKPSYIFTQRAVGYRMGRSE